ncbi:alpha,alpha-trehalase nth1 [Rhizina undulata]
MATNALQGRVSSRRTRATTSAAASLRANVGNVEDESSELSEPPSDLSDEELPTTSKYFQGPTVVKQEAGIEKKRKRTGDRGKKFKIRVKDIKEEWDISGIDEFMKGKIKKEPTPEMGDLVPGMIKKELENGEITDITSLVTTKGKGKAKTKVKQEPAAKVEPPEHWEEMYDCVKEMRSRISAPVDTMGCERLAEDDASPKVKRFQTLIALMLSSQTKDTVTAVAMRNLRNGLPGGLCLESILDVDPKKLDELIRPVGFHNRKTQYIKSAALLLRDTFAGDIPDTLTGLISLPGVGPKMAHLCLSVAWNRTEGIGVDVHVHRITNMWGWVKTTTPEGTREALEAWLPRDRWREINPLLVGFGQTICLPRGRKCGECQLAERGICKAAFKGDAKGKRRAEKGKRVEKAETDSENEEWVGSGGEKKSRVKRSRNGKVKMEESEVENAVKSEGTPPQKRVRRRVKLEVRNGDVGDIEDGGVLR